MTSWDPEDLKTSPKWRANEVVAMLHGIDFKRDDVRVARGSRSDAIYTIQTVRFQCGCNASDDAGWTSCGLGLHTMLAGAFREGQVVRSYSNLRSVFDAVVAEAWKRYGRQPENYYEFYEARARAPFLAFSTWQRNHDLLGQHVWEEGMLRAELHHIPLEKYVSLYNAGNAGHITLLLELCGERQQPLALPASPVDAVRTVFGA